MTQNIEDTPEHNVPEPESESVKSDAKEPATESKPAAHKRTRKTPAPVIENSVSLPVVAAPVQHATAVVGSGDTDDVFLSKLVFKAYSKKSLSVHHLQRRLNELGYSSAYADLDGWYGELTHEAVAQFQIDRKIEPASGLVDAETAKAIFDGDPNVTLVLA